MNTICRIVVVVALILSSYLSFASDECLKTERITLGHYVTGVGLCGYSAGRGEPCKNSYYAKATHLVVWTNEILTIVTYECGEDPYIVSEQIGRFQETEQKTFKSTECFLGPSRGWISHKSVESECLASRAAFLEQARKPQRREKE